MRRENGGLTLADLPSKMSSLKQVGENLTDQDRASFIQDSYQNLNDDVDFELFLRVITHLLYIYMLCDVSNQVLITFDSLRLVKNGRKLGKS